MASLSIYIAIIVIVLTLAVYFRGRKRSCTLPGPRGWPLIGIYPSLDTAVYKSFAELAERYGDMFYCRIAATDVVVVNKYEVAEEMFRKRQGAFNDRFIKLPDHLDITIGITELPYGEKWKELRNFTMTALNNQDLGDRTFEDLFHNEVSRCFSFIGKENGQAAFNPRHEIFHCIGNIGLGLIFGTRIEYNNEKMMNLRQAAFDLGQSMAIFPFFSTPNRIQYGSRFSWLKPEIYRKCIVGHAKIMAECQRLIKEHVIGKKINDSTAKDFVDFFRSAADTKKVEGKNTFLTESTLEGITGNLMSAGLETTAVMVTWFVLLLTKYPEVQKKLRKEVMDTIGGERLPTMSDREHMTYTRAVIQETHSFGAVAPIGAFHMPKEDVEFNGHFIPKDTYIIINLWGIHHDESLFPDPFAYKPERFINEAGDFVRSKYVNPYSVGMRSCPGEVLAQRQLFLVLTRLVQEFQFLPEEGQGLETIPEEGVFTGITLVPPEFHARFVPMNE